MSTVSITTHLTGKVALITGGAKRLGKAVAYALHQQGAQLVIHYRNSQAGAEALVAELNALRSNSAITLRCDLLDTDALPQLITQTIQQFSRLDILVNNASSFYATPIGSITETQWNDLLGSNVKAPLFLAQAAAPHLRATQGLILNMVDIHAQRPLPDYSVYCVAKAGLVMLTKSLARELAPDIRVNAIAPGPVLWPEQPMRPELQQEIISKTALKRQGSPDDIARAALFFAQDAPYVTGQILAIDGGRSIGW
ncbi:MAG: pteridine reductase [Steroidobacteraceae bacterium]